MSASRYRYPTRSATVALLYVPGTYAIRIRHTVYTVPGTVGGGVAVSLYTLCRCVAVSPSVFGIYDSVFSVFMDKVNFGIKTNLCQEF